MRAAILLLGLILVLAQAATAQTREFYVAPAGNAAGDGSREQPWDLGTALAQPPSVKPGDTIWLRGGMYRGAFASKLTGTEAAPIVVRQARGERATIDCRVAQGSSLFTVDGAWTVYRDFEVTCSNDATRVTQQAGSFPNDVDRGGIHCRGAQIRFVNLVVHDTGNAIGFWAEGEGGEISGCILYNCGWRGPDRGHGHGIYAQNRTGTKRLVDNIIFNQFAYGIHAYGSDKASLNGFHLEGNVSFNNGAPAGPDQGSPNIHVGGGCPADRVVLARNYTYHSRPATDVRLGYAGLNGSLELRDNYFAGYSDIRLWRSVTTLRNTWIGDDSLVSLETPEGTDPKTYRWNENEYFASRARYTPHVLRDAGKPFANGWQEWRDKSGFDAQGSYTIARPTGVRIFVRPNRDEPGRANVIVYNWDRKEAVAVDLKQVLKPGQRFRIVNAQDFYGPPVVSGAFGGDPISIPMKPSPTPPPVGMPGFRPPVTEPEFGAFVVMAG